MRKALVLILAAGLVFGSLAGPGLAKKKKAKAQAITFYLHGDQPIDDVHIADRWLNSVWHKMDENEPSGQSKSQFVTNYIGGPNTACSGNGLLPVWRGTLSGKVNGDVKLTIGTIASPGSTLEAELFPDASGGCNEAAQPPAAVAEVSPAAGQSTTEIVFENVSFEAIGSLTLQLNMNASPGQIRIFYDGADAPSSLEFKCTPTSGKSCL